MIGEDGKQIGIIAVSDALTRARELGVDLVEIAPHASPVVCRLVDYKKFKYELAKREREARKHIREVELKEVRLGPFISEHDRAVRLKQIREFLGNGDRVKVTVRFTGRQMAHPEFGVQLLEDVLKELSEISVVEREPHFEGRRYFAVLLPKQSLSRPTKKG